MDNEKFEEIVIIKEMLDKASDAVSAWSMFCKKGRTVMISVGYWDSSDRWRTQCDIEISEKTKSLILEELSGRVADLTAKYASL